MTPATTPGNAAPDLVLASGSPTRARLLAAAGVPFRVVAPAGVEETMKAMLRADGVEASAAALALATAKARAVSTLEPGALILGADQIADLEGHWLDKPGTREAARAQLDRLRGRDHKLLSAVVLVQNGVPLWSHVEPCHLVMRAFSDAVREAYLADPDDGFLGCAGGYEIEGRGIALFERVQGDVFAIQGLPLLPVLAALRTLGVLPT
ncbi:Maf family protein [Pararhodospirillum oryzae]|uniref:Nucleoside triphosphate pyrophosphatase n=1 Tax=Pararhodospirillum oryzae TaxID=478448 RepID=A0A512H3M2_9PROT|nr:Maf family protein [Pararhodospirillum oryzae]GEO80054.1 Maf-like protein [Pararhodospirillum oryzae]